MMENELMSRRNMLRGTLAVGCSLLLPGVLSGCDSKKPTTPAPDNAPSAGTEPAPGMQPDAPAASGKMSQASAQYQAQPKGDQKCADCMHFVAGSNTCTQVEGQISPEGWCTLWAKKV
jgi:hypothetical protein